MLQAVRKNRKGAGQAALIQGGTLTLYSLYYLVYSLFGLKGASLGSKLLNVVLSLSHVYSSIRIIKFGLKALE